MYASQLSDCQISTFPPPHTSVDIAEPPIFLLGQLDTLEKLAAQLTETLRSTEYHTSLFFETASEETKTAKAVLANAPPSERLKILVETIGLCSEIAARNRQAISRIF